MASKVKKTLPDVQAEATKFESQLVALGTKPKAKKPAGADARKKDPWQAYRDALLQQLREERKAQATKKNQRPAQGGNAIQSQQLISDADWTAISGLQVAENAANAGYTRDQLEVIEQAKHGEAARYKQRLEANRPQQPRISDDRWNELNQAQQEPVLASERVNRKYRRHVLEVMERAQPGVTQEYLQMLRARKHELEAAAKVRPTFWQGIKTWQKVVGVAGLFVIAVLGGMLLAARPWEDNGDDKKPQLTSADKDADSKTEVSEEESDEEDASPDAETEESESETATVDAETDEGSAEAEEVTDAEAEAEAETDAFVEEMNRLGRNK